jgi:peptide/nickel transport system ATP-binding protein
MLDASLRIEILDLLLDLKNRLGMACLFITHDLVARYFVKGGKVIIMYLGSIVESGPTEDIILDPLHPYTKILIASVPVPDPKLARSRGLPPLRSLEVPSLTKVPSGCKFHPRCPYAEEICTKTIPELKNVGKDRFVACHQ